MVETLIELDVDDEVVLRCTENWDENDQPQPVRQGHKGWRDQQYDLATPAEVFEHLAYNVVANNMTLSRLDGWADLTDDKMRVISETTRAHITGRVTASRLVSGEATQ